MAEYDELTPRERALRWLGREFDGLSIERSIEALIIEAQNNQIQKARMALHQAEWQISRQEAALRIAHFRKTNNGELIFMIENEPKGRTGVRVWSDVAQREFWYKVKQIKIPTLIEILMAAAKE